MIFLILSSYFRHYFPIPIIESHSIRAHQIDIQCIVWTYLTFSYASISIKIEISLEGRLNQKSFQPANFLPETFLNQVATY